MKKIFTFVFLALGAMSVNAQEVWTVNNEDGTLKTDYVANEDPNAMSVVSFSTANVEGVHTSGPVAGYNDGDNPPLDPKVDNTWGGIQTKALSADGSVAPFYYVQGKGNPVNLDKIKWEEIVTDDVPTGVYRADWNDSYYMSDGSAGLPKNGTYVTLKTKVAGKMKVAAWINKGSRDIYIVKASDAKALALGTDVIISGYINGQNWADLAEDNPLSGYPAYQENIATKGTEGTDAYVVGAGNQAAWVYLTFDAQAGETYYVFNKNTPIGFSGFEFIPAGTGISEITSSDNADAPVYNLTGQRVSKDTKGMLIKNGKKFINK